MHKKVLFVYLTQATSEYFIKEKLEYNIQRRSQLGFQYMCAVLEKKGVESEILDQTITHFSLEELVQKLNNDNYYFAGFYSAVSMQGKVMHYIKKIKQKNKIPILVGGPGFLRGEQYLKAGCDIVCNGEGEKTIYEIVRYLKGKIPIEEIKGISYMKNGRIVTNKPQELIENLDELPFPNRDKIDIKYYRDFYIINMRLPYTTIITSRGCFHRCSFCTSHVIWGNKVRKRSPENVISEIDHLVDKYGIRYLAFQDDVFGFNRDWVEKFCNMLIERKHKLNWMCILHPFSFRNAGEKFLNLLKRAGCDTVSMGLQSAHPNILKNIRRHPEEPGAVRELVKIAKKNDMLTFVTFILGLPGENKATIDTSIDFALAIKPNYVEFYSLSVLEGSELEQMVKINNRICELGEEEIKEHCIYATKKFYTNPSVMLNNIWYILRRRITWPFVMLRFLPHLLSVTGIRK